MDLDRLMTRVNPLIAGVLRSPFHWILSPGLLLLTVTGRRTGRRYSIPGGYQRDGDRLVVLVSKAARKRWWRNYEEPGPVEVVLAGTTLQGMAWVIPEETFEFRRHVERTFQRMPWLARQFDLAYDRRTGLTDDQVERLGVEARVVQIEIRPPRGVGGGGA